MSKLPFSNFGVFCEFPIPSEFVSLVMAAHLIIRAFCVVKLEHRPTLAHNVIFYNITARILRKILHEQSKLREGWILQKEAANKVSGVPKETLTSQSWQTFL